MKKNSPILRFFFIILLFQLPASLLSQEMVKGNSDNRFIYGIPDSLITLIQDAIPGELTAEPLKPRKLLVINLNRINGEVWKGHPSIPYSNYALNLMGKTTGAWETWFSNDTLIFKPEFLRQFDAICFNNTAGVLFDDEFLRQSLLDYVFSGGHPWGPEDTITLRIDDPRHPVNAAFKGKSFTASDEVFQFTDPYTCDKHGNNNRKMHNAI